jgi:hypothetical protein
MKVLDVLMLASLGIATTAGAQGRGGGGGGPSWWLDWPDKETRFDNEYVKQVGSKTAVWFGACRSKNGEWYPAPGEDRIMALGVFPHYVDGDLVHTKFYVYPYDIGNTKYLKIMNSIGDPKEEEDLYPEAEKFVSEMRGRYETSFKFKLKDGKGKATLKDVGSWQWYEQNEFYYNSATLTLKSFKSAWDKPVLYFSAVHHNPEERVGYSHCIFTHNIAPLLTERW